MPCRIPTISPAYVPELRAFLRRFEVEDCDCPLYLSCPCKQECDDAARIACPHCLETCNCPPEIYQPPCRHTRTPDPSDMIDLREWFARLFPRRRAAHDSECLELLCVAADPDQYLDPPPGLPDLRVQSRSRRVEVMARRWPAKGPKHAIRHPWDRWGREERPEAAQTVGRAMNGTIIETGLTHA